MITALKLIAYIQGNVQGLQQAAQQTQQIMSGIQQQVNNAGRAIYNSIPPAWKTVGTSVVAAGVQTSQAINTMNKAVDGFRGRLNQLSTQLMSAGMQATAAFTAPIIGMAKMGLEFNDLERRTTRSFATMVGGKKAADELFNSIVKFATYTPFSTDSLVKYANQMLSVGMATKDTVLPQLKAIGDFMAQRGMGEAEINRAVLALGQMKTAGRVTGSEMRQLTENRIPAWQMLAKHVGVTTGELKDLVTKGLVPADKAIQAIMFEMEQNAPNAMKKFQDTLQSQTAALRDNFQQLAGSFTNQKNFSFYESLIAGLTRVNKGLETTKGLVSSWSTEVKTKIIAGLAGLSSVGPLLLIFGGLARAIATILTPMGALSVAMSVGISYLIQHKKVAQELGEKIQQILPPALKLWNSGIKSVEQAMISLWPTIQKIIPSIIDLGEKGFNFVQGSIVALWPTIKETVKIFGMLFEKIEPLIGSLLNLGGEAIKAVSSAATALLPILGFLVNAFISIGGPIIKGVVDILTTILRLFNWLPDPIKNMIVWLGAGAIAFGALAGPITAAIGFFTTIGATIATLGTTLTFTLIPAIGVLQKSLLLLGMTPVPTILGVLSAAAVGAGIGLALWQDQVGKYYDQANATEAARMATIDKRPKYKAFLQAQQKYDKAYQVAKDGPKDRPELAGITKAEQLYFDKYKIYVAQLKKEAENESDILMGRLKPGAIPGPNGTVNQWLGMPDVGNVKNPGKVELDNSRQLAQAAKNLESHYQSRLRIILEQNAQLNVQIAGEVRSTEVAKVRQQLQTGYLKGLSDEKAMILLNVATEKDQLTIRENAVKQYRSLMHDFVGQQSAAKEALSIGSNATDSEQMAIKLNRQIAKLKDSVSGLTAAELANLNTKRDHIVADTQALELQKAFVDIHIQRGLLNIQDDQRRRFEESMGPQKMKTLRLAGRDGEAFQDWRANLRDETILKATQQIQDLTFETGHFGEEGYKAAIQFLGGLQNLSLFIGTTVIDDLKKAIDYNRIYNSINQQKLGLEAQKIESLRRVSTETDKANDAFEQMLDPSKISLSEEQRQGIEKIRLEIIGLTKDIDRVQAERWRSDTLRGLEDQLDSTRSKMMAMYSSGKLAAQEWVRSNYDALEKIKAQYNDITEGENAVAQAIYDATTKIVQQDILNQQLQVMDQVRQNGKELQMEALKLHADSPFKAWTMDFYIFDEATQHWKKPEWLDEGLLKKQFNLREMQQFISGIASGGSDIVTNSFASMFTPSQEDLQKFSQLQSSIHKVKMDLTKDPSNQGLMNQLRDMQKESSKLAKKIHGDLGSAFDRLFKGILTGFSQLLQKMAMEYLQSQLAQSFTKILSSAFGAVSAASKISAGVHGATDWTGPDTSTPEIDNTAAMGTDYMPAGRKLRVGEHGVEFIEANVPIKVTPNHKIVKLAYGTDYLPANTTAMVGEYGEEIASSVSSRKNKRGQTESENDNSDSMVINNFHFHLPNVVNNDQFRRAAPVTAAEAYRMGQRQKRRTE